MKRHPGTHLLELCLVLLLAAASPAGARDRGVPPSEGIGNFGKVNDSLYRGAQPDAAGIKNLAQLGIKTIINLCMTNELWKAEASEASAIGITYTNVPLKGLGRPSDAQVAKLLTLIEALPGPVFIHCQHGCDRTGTIVACEPAGPEEFNSALSVFRVHEARKNESTHSSSAIGTKERRAKNI